MTSTEEAVESIEHLDFTPPCEVKAQEVHEAAWIVACRGCDYGAFVCGGHLSKWKQAIGIDVARGAVVVCSRCYRRSPSFADAVEVLPL